MPELVCPKCRCSECTADGSKLNIRGYKVHRNARDGWESHCLLCDIWFSESGRITEEKRND